MAHSHVAVSDTCQTCQLLIAIDSRQLGDDAFWAGVKDYLTTFAGCVVETDDFRKCLEKHSGTNLTKFFDQWY